MIPKVITLNICTIVILILTILVSYYVIVISMLNEVPDCTCESTVLLEDDGVRIVEARDIKHRYHRPRNRTILFWNQVFGNKNFYLGDGDIFESCPLSNCYATSDRNYTKLEDFDALMFHGCQLDPGDLPKRRSPHQVYIFENLEPHSFHPITKNVLFRNYFNWTMTYRRDSDLMRPYGVFRNVTSNEAIPPHIPAVWKDVSKGKISDETRNITRGKDKMIAWFVSHCNTDSKRELYAKELQKHISVDIYGKCGPLKCDRSKEEDCFEILEMNYYFYLAFENSFCNDYVTEKVFRYMRYDVVPIVYGAADYISVLPPNSFIDTRDFASPKELADYLWSLSRNTERYLGFFKWKSFYKVEFKPEHYTICKLCERLNEDIRFPQTVGDVYKWWTEDQCGKKPIFPGVT